MDPAMAAKIKQAVVNNFEQSPDTYQAFEEEFGFFDALTTELIRPMSLPGKARVLDVGCGSGASIEPLLRAFPDGQIWGLDISPAMLKKAQDRYIDEDRVKLILGDAAQLTKYVDTGFDAVLYTASIFLIPDYLLSLEEAHSLLKDGGVAAATFIDGIYDQSDRNALAQADESAQTGINFKKAVVSDELKAAMKARFTLFEMRTVDFTCSVSMLKAFYSIPAQSAGLYPKLDYPTRLAMINRIFSLLSGEGLAFRWHILAGLK
ncbi:MAG: methyltransferase domain-containing protein [Deltaproteobacteria bacterium]|nr:methyltransferase domain-containing protein [Deltaproteobacteria bacterium]